MSIKNFIVSTFSVCLSIGLIILGTNIVEAEKSSKDFEKEHKKGLVSLYKSLGNSESDLEEYKKFAKQKTKELKDNKITDIAATITFEEPISYKELQDYIKKHDITPIRIHARGLEGRKRITGMLPPEHTEEHAKMLFENEGAKFIGYIDLYAKIDYKSIDNIEKDHNTYLLDVSGDSYYAEQFSGKKNTEKFPHALSWKLEEIKK